MDESSWKLIEIMIWLSGIQTTLIIAIMGFVWNNLCKRIDKLENRIDKLENKIEDVDRRLCRIEGSLAVHGHCMFSQTKPEQKAE